MSELEIRYLTALAETRARTHANAREDDERLEDYVLELRESGCSVSVIADTLDVGRSTVQAWTNNARRRRVAPAAN